MKQLQKGNELYSINPFLPCYEYIPDGEPRIFGDRVYVYGSHDLVDQKNYCAGDYVTWSAPLDNLANWRFEGVIYRRTQDPYVKKILDKGKGNMMNSHFFAPDVIEIEGKYYMYYGIGLAKCGFGVAVSDSPVGPFEYIGRVRYPESEKPAGWKDGKDGIDDGDFAFGYGKNVLAAMGHYPYDPAVLYDNGHLYLYYGLSYCRMVELDMTDKRTVLQNPQTGRYESEVLVPGTISPFGKAKKLAASDGMGMVNAPSIRKYDDIYYLVYYASGKPGCEAMCYATAKSPFGPFVYGGILVSDGNAKRNGNAEVPFYAGNVHGGMLHVNDKWYTIFHRHTGIGLCGRQGCVAQLTRREDGGFEHAEHNSQGFRHDPLPAYYEWPAYMSCYLTDKNGKTKRKSNSPIIYQTEYPEGPIDDHSGKNVLQVVGNTTDGSVAGYRYFDFGEISKESMDVLIRMKSESKGYVDIYADAPGIGKCGVGGECGIGEFLGRVEIADENKEWRMFTGKLKPLTGKHAIYFVFHCDGKILGEFSWFGFGEGMSKNKTGNRAIS